jgi:4-carboxymuconolactone decarboxylase
MWLDSNPKRFWNMVKTDLWRVLLVGMLLAMTSIGMGSLAAQDRMPPIPYDKQTPEQKKVSDEYKRLRKMDLTTAPWSVLLRVPDLVIPSLQLRLHNQTDSALSPKLTEFAILIASRQLSNNFEWNAHVGDAKKGGLSQGIIDAIIDGRRPERMAEDEEIIYDFSKELLRNQSVSDPTYARALAKFGEPGVVEAASLEGYYVFLALVMNATRSPVAPGVTPALTPYPRNQ